MTQSDSPLTPQLPPESLLSGEQSDAERVYVALASLFAVMLVLTNIIGVKLIYLFRDTVPEGLFGGPFVVTTGLLTYPITFLLTDIVSEIWGRKRANFMVVLGFISSFVMLGLVQLAVYLEGAPPWINTSLGYTSVGEMQQGFESVFRLPGILVFASMSAYLVAQFIDVQLFHFWRRLTAGKHLWLRNNASTWVSQLVDTIIVNVIFLKFGLDLPNDIIFEIIVTIYLFKVVLAALDTPLFYLSLAGLKRYLKIKD